MLLADFLRKLHIDHIFLNTQRVDVLHSGFLYDKNQLDDEEHRYSNYDPFVVTVKYQ